MKKIILLFIIASVFAENNQTFKEGNETINFKLQNPLPITKEKNFIDNIEVKGCLRFRFEKDI